MQILNNLADILSGCRKNDRKAQFELYNMFFQPLMRVARRYKKNDDDAAAVVNETFFRALTKLDKYKTGVPFENWIKRITLNILIDEYREKKKKEAYVEIGEFNDTKNDIILSSATINYAEENFAAKDILKLIDELDEQEKIIFNLYEMDGLSHLEISEQLNLSERSSKRYLQSARIKLKSKINSLLQTARILVL